MPGGSGRERREELGEARARAARRSRPAAAPRSSSPTAPTRGTRRTPPTPRAPRAARARGRAGCTRRVSPASGPPTPSRRRGPRDHRPALVVVGLGDVIAGAGRNPPTTRARRSSWSVRSAKTSDSRPFAARSARSIWKRRSPASSRTLARTRGPRARRRTGTAAPGVAQHLNRRREALDHEVALDEGQRGRRHRAELVREPVAHASASACRTSAATTRSASSSVER